MSMSGSISKDFPLYHSTIIPTYESPEKNKYKHVHKKAKNGYIFTNEHPDIFRLEGMKEGGYFNPFLDKIIKVDRSEYFKKLSSDRKNVNFIDFLKSNRKYSQDPKILRYISCDFNKELKHKRMGKNNKSLNTEENKENEENNKSLNTEENKENEENKNSRINSSKKRLLTEGNYSANRKKYYSLLKKLNYFVPRIDYRIKRTIDIDNKQNNSININSISIDLEKDNLYKKISTGIDPKLSYNLRNSNVFELNNNEKNINDDFKFQRKIINQYNPIKDKMEKIKPPPYKNERWSSFLENYFLLANSKKQFLRKGGYFSEFSNKNIGSINNNKYDIQQRLKKEKIEKEKMKEKSPGRKSCSN